MGTWKCKARWQSVLALCFATGVTAVWATTALAQDQASPGEQATGGSTQPERKPFYSLGGFAQTHSSSVGKTGSPQAPPQYPPAAIRAHHEGTVVVMALIGANGQVTDAKVEQSSGYRELDQSAVVAVGGWTFRPAYRDGVPVVSYRRVPVDFHLNKTAATP